MRKSTHTAGYQRLRESLRAAREEAGLSQRDLAALLDVPHSVVAKIESGERRIDPIEMCWFLDACDADASAVFDEARRHAGKPRERRRGKGMRA